MTINRTTLLDLPLPVTGTESGTWGDTTNNGLTQYMDIAIAGALSITTDVTLATTEGDASGTGIVSTTAQYRTLIVPASGPSANVVITAPSSDRTYHVINRNATYTVQVRAGANSGVTLGVNQSATVGYDSVAGDYVLVGPIGPTVPVSRGGTGATTLTANNVLLGNGTSAVQFVAPGTAGNVLTSDGTTWTSTASNVITSGNNAFTGANTFYNATGQAFAPASTNDGIIVLGRAGGSSSYRVTFATTTLSASRTLTLPDATDTVAVVGTAQTFTAAQTFRAANAIRSEAASTQDAIVLAGRAGGTSSYAATLTPATLSANVTLTLPATTGTLLTNVSPVTVAGNSSEGASIRLPEDTDNGTNYVALKAPDSLAADYTCTLPDETCTLGFRNIPQNSQSAAYTLVLTDAGKHILHPSADTTARTFTIPANSSVAFPIGTAITFINQNGAGTVTIAITTDTMRLSPGGTTGSRTLAADGVATCIKLTSTEWIISGTGLS